jgi:hypothetical protein
MLAYMDLTEWSRVHADVTSMQKRETGLGLDLPNRPMGWCTGPGEILVMIELQNSRGEGIALHQRCKCGPHPM